MTHTGIHHLHARKKAGKVFRGWKKQFETFMYVVAIVSPLSYAPQVYKLYSTQDADGLAIMSFASLFFINALWLVYAAIHRATPLVITSIFFCAFHVIIVTGIVLFS